jgi:predicted alpha/beta-fold hydrolase
VTFEITDWGGHTGFVAGPWPWRPIYWAEERAIAWLDAARLSAPARQ